MSVALDVLDEMIKESAVWANHLAVNPVHGTAFRTYGADTGVGNRLTCLKEARAAIQKAEMQELERLRLLGVS